MRKLVSCVVLASATAGLVFTAGGPSTAVAQPKKAPEPKTKVAPPATPTAPPATTAPAAADIGTIEISKDKAGKFRFKVVGSDDKTLAMCTKGYETKEEAMKALDAVKATLAKGKVVEAKDEK